MCPRFAVAVAAVLLAWCGRAAAFTVCIEHSTGDGTTEELGPELRRQAAAMDGATLTDDPQPGDWVICVLSLRLPNSPKFMLAAVAICRRAAPGQDVLVLQLLAGDAERDQLARRIVALCREKIDRDTAREGARR
jgi:hypothetical protein